MKFNLKPDVLLIGITLIFTGVALDRGIHFVNWKLIGMGMSGEQIPQCPAEVKHQASTPVTAPTPLPSPLHTLPPVSSPIPIKGLEALTPLASVASKPIKTEIQGKEKEKEDPAVNVDLTSGRKGTDATSVASTAPSK